jgi:hypothetical protein
MQKLHCRLSSQPKHPQKMGFGLFNKSEEKCRRIVKSSEEFFVTMDICSQPGLDQFYLGVVAVF